MAKLTALFLALSLPVAGFATAAAAKGDPVRGKQLSRDCFSCHREDGNSPSPVNPKIGGQHQRYLVLSMKEYRDGKRADSLMRGAVLNLTNQDMEDIAAYFAGQGGFGKEADAPARAASARPAGPGAGPPRGNMDFDHVERKATYTSLYAIAKSISEQAVDVSDEGCPTGDETLDSDNDGLADAFDAAPDDAGEFAADANGDGSYEICHIRQFEAIEALGAARGKATTLTRAERLNRNYQLVRDLDASDVANFLPVGNCGPKDNCMVEGDKYGYKGVFDGRGHVIRNLTISRTGRGGVGLFGVLSKSGAVMNVTVENGNIEGRAGTGMIVGSNMGTIYNAHARGTVSASMATGGVTGGNGGLVARSSAEGTVTGQQALGGLVGDMNGAVYDSSADSRVSGNRGIGGLVGLNTFGRILNSYAKGTVSGVNDLGGLVGMNTDANVSNSYSAVDVEGESSNIGGLIGFNSLSTVRNSYATGEVKGLDSVGGLIGRNNGKVRNSYARGAVSGESNTGGLVGATVEGRADASYGSPDARALPGQAKTKLETLDGSKTGWIPERMPAADLLYYFCDINRNGFIDPDERAAENYVWSFGAETDFPALTCTIDGLNAQRG